MTDINLDLEYCEICDDDDATGRIFSVLRDMDLCDTCYEDYRERDDELWEREHSEICEAKMKWKKWHAALNVKGD